MKNIYKQFKKLSLISISCVFLISVAFAQLDFDCNDVTVTCEKEQTVSPTISEPPVTIPSVSNQEQDQNLIDCGDGFRAPSREWCPSYVNYSSIETSQPNTPVFVNGPTNNTQPSTIVDITYRNSDNVDAAIRYGGVNINYNTGNTTINNPGLIYNSQPVYTQTQIATRTNSFVPVNWNNVNSYAQTYGQSQIYNNNQVPRITCPVNYTISSQNCIPNKKTCSDGSQVLFFENCTKICWNNGQRIRETESCSGSSSVQSYNTNAINYGNNVNYNSNNTYQTKTCSNGRVVNISDVCTKTCQNGNVINENYLCPAYDLNHSVNTLNISNIDTNFATCNAKASIRNSKNTIGYFEYGKTSSLGSVTNSSSIGNLENVNFSNRINNLESGTVYYCRAVITNSDGVFKGDTVSFKTLSAEKNYVSTIIYNNKKEIINQTTIKKDVKSVSKAEIKKDVSIVCKDENGETDILKEGEKFLLLEIENIDSKIVKGQEVNYIIKYKNNSNIDLENILMQININNDLTFVSASEGNFSNGILEIKLDDLKSKKEGLIKMVFKAKDDLAFGKNIIIGVNATYDMLDENNKVISDEVSDYVISTVTEKNNLESQNNFWSGFLFKFILILILLLILYILSRNIYKKIKHKMHHDQILHGH